MKEIKICHHIDDPQHFLLWSIDEMVPPMFGLICGILTDHMLLCLFFGFVLNHFYCRFRDNRPNGYLLHMCYWFLGIPLKGNCFKHPFIREFF